MAKKDDRKAVIMNLGVLCDERIDQVFEQLAKQVLSDPSFKDLLEERGD